MADGADEEGEDGGVGAAVAGPRGAVDVAAEEAVDGHVPLAAELHPVGAVPPVGVEVAVGKVRHLGKGAEDVLEDDEEDEEEGQHEGEEEPRDGLGEEEEALAPRESALMEPGRGRLQDGQDELLRDDGEEEDAAEDGHDLGDEVLPVDALGAGILDLIAQGRAEEEVDVVGPCQVLGVGDVAHGAGELARQVLTQVRNLLVLLVLVAVAAAAALRRVARPSGADEGAAGVVGGRVEVGRGAGGGGGVVELLQALLGLAEVAVVEGVRVHLHEDDHGVQQQEDLRGPGPVQHEGRGDPKSKPDDLVEALQRHAAPGPRAAARRRRLAHGLLEGQDARGAGDHGEVDEAQVPQLDGEEGPYLHAHGVPSVLDVAQHAGEGHDAQADPEEVEEAMEVAVVGVGVEVRDTARKLDGREDATALLGADLLACAREGLGRWESIGGYGG